MNQVIIRESKQKKWLQFKEPKEIISANCLEEVLPKLKLVNELIEKHQLYGAGFISYEASSAFDKVLVTHESSSFPLLWFGLYQQPKVIELPPYLLNNNYKLDWDCSVSKEEYNNAITRIKDYIACGDTYQVNYTLRLQADFAGEPWQLFQQLVQAQPADYAAYLELERFTICSASPELFFDLRGDRLISRPMKGTARRGYSLSQDKAIAQWLFNSEKNRAENVMIVDMIRNDLGKIAYLNSVRVASLFDVEKYPTLWQMTSTITAKTNRTLAEITTALFPCASITGAPKRRTMEIIRELENYPRNIYTGSIGFISPEGEAQFNVAIRTVLIDRDRKQAEYGIGSGIVWDSIAKDEYRECQLKAKVLYSTNH